MAQNTIAPAELAPQYLPANTRRGGKGLMPPPGPLRPPLLPFIALRCAFHLWRTDGAPTCRFDPERSGRGGTQGAEGGETSQRSQASPLEPLVPPGTPVEPPLRSLMAGVGRTAFGAVAYCASPWLYRTCGLESTAAKSTISGLNNSNGATLPSAPAVLPCCPQPQVPPLQGGAIARKPSRRSVSRSPLGWTVSGCSPIHPRKTRATSTRLPSLEHRALTTSSVTTKT